MLRREEHAGGLVVLRRARARLRAAHGRTPNFSNSGCSIECSFASKSGGRCFRLQLLADVGVLTALVCARTHVSGAELMIVSTEEPIGLAQIPLDAVRDDTLKGVLSPDASERVNHRPAVADRRRGGWR